MKLIKIIQILHVKDYILEMSFSDGCTKQFDFSELITFSGITEPLKKIEYFKSVKIIADGRAFGWDNNYDCCADWARYYAKDLYSEWIEFDDSISLGQRMKITRQKMQQKTDLPTTQLIN